MSKTKSLQYLLLDTLSKRKNIVSVDFASSLKVEEDNDNYIVSWKEKINQNEIRVKKNKFIFYRRNDIDNKKLDLSQSLSFNNNNANLIVDNILKKEKEVIKPLNFFKKYLTQVIIITTTLTTALYFSNTLTKIIPILLTIFLIFDLLEKKKIFFYLIIVLISWLYPDKYVLFYCIFLISFNILEPIYFFKTIKILLLSFSIFLNAYFVDISLTADKEHIILLSFLSIVVTLINFTKYNSNYNWVYCLPSFSFGFLLDNEIIISYLWMVNCLLLPMIFNHLDKKFFLKINTSPIFE